MKNVKEIEITIDGDIWTNALDKTYKKKNKKPYTTNSRCISQSAETETKLSKPTLGISTSAVAVTADRRNPGTYLGVSTLWYEN